MVQVRNSWVVRSEDEAQPFYDKAEFEDTKRHTGGIEQWIEEQLTEASVTVALFCAETYDRKWVSYEIKRSYELKKGMLAIDIHSVKDPQKGTDTKSKKPLDYRYIEKHGNKTYFSDMYETYDWVNDDGYTNLATWIENAAKAVGR
ncbi:TPA: TIR domain-containing protein [Photobacterium damselae]